MVLIRVFSSVLLDDSNGSGPDHYIPMKKASSYCVCLESILSELILGQSEVEIRNHQMLINSSLLSQLLNFSRSEVIVIVPDDLALTLRL